MRGEEPVHQGLQAVGLLDDHAGVFAQAGPVELALKELGRAAQSSEGVLDFVGEVADQLPVRAVLAQALLFALDAQPLVDGPQLEQQRGLRQFDRRRDAVEVQRLLARRGQGQVLISETALLANRLLEQAPEGT